MKKLISLIAGFILASVLMMAQSGQWERTGVKEYGTGGYDRNGKSERIDNRYSNGSFNSEIKSNDANKGYIIFRKATFSTPAASYKPGASFTVNMSMSVKLHRGSGITPSGTAGAAIVYGEAGSNTSVNPALSLKGRDQQGSKSLSVTFPTRQGAGSDVVSIVYSCLDMKVVYRYKWVSNDPAPVQVMEPQVTEEAPVIRTDPEPVADPEPVVEEIETTEPVFGIVHEDDEDMGCLGEMDLDSEAWPESEQVETSVEDEQQYEEKPSRKDNKSKASKSKSGKKAKSRRAVQPKSKMDQVLFSFFGKDFTLKETLLYGGGGLLGILLIVLLLVLLLRKGDPEKKAAKEAARAEAMAAAQAAAAERKAAMEKAAAERKAAMEKAAAERKAQAEAAMAARQAAAAEAKEKAEKAAAERKAAMEKAAAERKAQAEAAMAARQAAAAEAKAKAEAAAKAPAAEAPAAKEEPAAPAEAKPTPRFCEACGAPLEPGAKFCGQCGHKIG